MDKIREFFNNIGQTNLIKSIIVIILSIILYTFIAFLLDRYQKRTKFKLFTSKKSISKHTVRVWPQIYPNGTTWPLRYAV